MPPYEITEFARHLRRDHTPLSLGRVLLAQAVRLPAAGRLKPALYNTAYLYPIGLLHSTATQSSQGLLIGIADVRAGDGTSMFLVLWEFEVKPGCEKRFERVYGPGGDWDSLFRRDPPPCGKSFIPRYGETACVPHCRVLALAQIVRRVFVRSGC